MKYLYIIFIALIIIGCAPIVESDGSDKSSLYKIYLWYYAYGIVFFYFTVFLDFIRAKIKTYQELGTTEPHSKHCVAYFNFLISWWDPDYTFYDDGTYWKFHFVPVIIYPIFWILFIFALIIRLSHKGISWLIDRCITDTFNPGNEEEEE